MDNRTKKRYLTTAHFLDERDNPNDVGFDFVIPLYLDNDPQKPLGFVELYQRDETMYAVVEMLRGVFVKMPYIGLNVVGNKIVNASLVRAESVEGVDFELV